MIQEDEKIDSVYGLNRSGNGCFSGDTLIFTPVRQFIPLRDAWERNIIINVWSYNIEKKDVEFKRANVHLIGERTLRCVSINDMMIWVTADQHFLTSDLTYVPNSDIDDHTFLRGVKMEETEEFLSDNKLMSQCVSQGVNKEEAFSVKVEDGDNFIVVTEFDHHHYSGIVVKG